MSALLPAAIATLIDAAAARYNVAPGLARAVAWVESRGNARAVSPKGAMGVFQLMPNTAKGLGVLDAFDPEQNVDGGVRYLRQLLDRFEDPGKALAAYNWGPSRVARGSTWPDSVRRYVRLVSDRYDLEDGALAASSSTPRLALDEGSDVAAVPFAGSGLPLSPPPHCVSCTCKPDPEDDCDA